MSSQEGLFYAWFMAMHTRIDLMLSCCQDEQTMLNVVRGIYETVHRLEQIANFYDSESELFNLNRTAFISPQTVSDDLYDMILFCFECYARTSGCFDITVQSVPHTSNTIHQISLSHEDHTVYFRKPGIKLDLSGFLKGYALNKVRKILDERKVKNALVNMGNSSILAIGNHPIGNGWRIAFLQDYSTLRDKKQDVWLHDEYLTVSGNEFESRSHIINPQNGSLITGKRKVAVVTNDGAIGEVLSTALFVANSNQRAVMQKEFEPRLILDI